MTKDIEQKVSQLLEKMTLAEKVGQLQQCGPSIVGAFGVDFEELVNMVFDGRISKEKFQEMMSSSSIDLHEDDLRAGKVGSYNGISDAKTANYLQKIAIEETRLGIPLLFGYDVIHGYRTIFPIPLAESCAWDPELWEKTARVSAVEATAGGNHMTFAPMIDVSKDARWGRVSESPGEDTYLTSRYGVAKIRGFQGNDLSENDAMAACIKHFAAYGAAEAGRDYNRVDMSMQRLCEEYLPPFEASVKAGARAVMPAFNDINGIPCTVNEWLLQDVLRKQWGFNGMTISDANAIAECVDHGIVADRAEAAMRALRAGVDMDMTSNCYVEHVEELVDSGKLEISVLDQAVGNILRLKFELGLFDRPYQTDENREKNEMLKPEYRELAREAAVKSMVLLKNDGVLPLTEDVKLGIVGALADNRGEMTGAWAIKADSNDCLSIVDACQAEKLPHFYTAGIIDSEDGSFVDDQSVAELAYASDVIVAVVGESKVESGEAASRAEINLPLIQLKLLEQLYKTGKPVVVVLFNGRPLAIPSVQQQAAAILEAWHPGVEAGNAVLDILYGKVNPSGKLTTTFPYATGQCPIYYSHINTGRPAGRGKFTSKYLDTPIEPVYPFGYGLSYTTYTYSDLYVQIGKEELLVSINVENSGVVDGEEIVQCYFRNKVGTRVRPVRELAAFTRVKLQAGERQMVQLHVPISKFGYYDWDMSVVVDNGEYEIFVGGNTVEGLSTKIEL